MYAVLGIKEFWIRFKKNKMKYLCFYMTGFLLYAAYAGMLLAATVDGTATINNF